MNAEVDAYIASQEPWKREILETLRGAVHKADPEIEEKIKWGTPAFDHNGQVAWMFCATEWVHFSYPQGALLDDSHGMWDEGEDTTSKAKRTLKFREGDEVPIELIVRLTRQAVQNNLEGKKVDFKIPKAGSREFDLPKEYVDFLKENSMLEAYLARPYYQQKGWVQWIEQAKHEETREKRKRKMLEELRDGTYMPPKD